jgi:hypothetical protein
VKKLNAGILMIYQNKKLFYDSIINNYTMITTKINNIMALCLIKL